jgi:hypothetical protein
MFDRIAHNTSIYHPVIADEGRFEAQLNHFAPHCFPDYHWINFKCVVDSPTGKVHADAALVARDYSRWIVVEVELAKHSWDYHILPQLSKLLVGFYNSSHRQTLLSASADLTPQGLAKLDIYHPEFALIIDVLSPQARSWCHFNHIYCLEAYPYKSRDLDSLIGINGDELPSVSFSSTTTPVAFAKRTELPSDVVMLDYTVGTWFTESDEPFICGIGEHMCEGQNFGSAPRRMALTAHWSLLEETFGDAWRFELIQISPGHYTLKPKVATGDIA